MTINLFVLRGDLNGKIVVVRFFFFVGYISSIVKRDIFYLFSRYLKNAIFWYRRLDVSSYGMVHIPIRPISATFDDYKDHVGMERHVDYIT